MSDEQQPKKKALPELTEAELRRDQRNVEAVIQTLEDMNTAELSLEQRNEWEETLDQAYQVVLRIELEQVGRLMDQLQSRVAQSQERSDEEARQPGEGAGKEAQP